MAIFGISVGLETGLQSIHVVEQLLFIIVPSIITILDLVSMVPSTVECSR